MTYSPPTVPEDLPVTLGEQVLVSYHDELATPPTHPEHPIASTWADEVNRHLEQHAQAAVAFVWDFSILCSSSHMGNLWSSLNFRCHRCHALMALANLSPLQHLSIFGTPHIHSHLTLPFSTVHRTFCTQHPF